MNEQSETKYVASGFGGVGTGVCWYIWTKGTLSAATFFWGLLYGAFWPVWLGYRLAEILKPLP